MRSGLIFAYYVPKSNHMKKLLFRRLFWAVCVLLALCVQACNRGLGCPSDF